jgi:DNA-binding transcriptional LysR family regulator
MSLDLEALHAFVKVAEVGSFTQAAVQLAVSKSRASSLVAALEDSLGVRLLQRTTRAVRLTPDGEQLLARARRLLADADEVGALFTSRGVTGRLRIDLPVNLARAHVIPALPALLAAHPGLELFVSTTDRRVDLVREGFDCVLRVGAQPDSGLTARRLGAIAMANAASPAYLARHGVPRTLADLGDHVVVHYASGDDTPSFEIADGRKIRQIPMRAQITVNSTDAYRVACECGLGIIQAPRLGLRDAFASRRLTEILPRHAASPLPVWLVHAYGRTPPSRVRLVLDVIAQALAPVLASA